MCVWSYFGEQSPRGNGGETPDSDRKEVYGWRQCILSRSSFTRSQSSAQPSINPLRIHARLPFECWRKRVPNVPSFMCEKKFNQERSDRSPSEERKPRSLRVCATLMEFKHDRSRCSYLWVVADNYLLTTLGRQRRREIIQTTTTGRGPLAPAAPSHFSGVYLFNCQIRLRVSTSLWTEKRGGGQKRPNTAGSLSL